MLSALLAAPAAARASTEAAACSVNEIVQTAHGRMKIAGGVEPNRVWVVADFNGLQVRKFTAKGGASVIELRYDDDSIVLSLSRAANTISRGGRAVNLGTPKGVDDARQLVGGSPAMFHARVLLSRYEQTSDLKGPSMSLLSALAVAATLTGDVDAPRRLSERFLERHRGVLRRVRDDGSCWTEYEKEVNAALHDYEACLAEASTAVWYRVYSRVIECGLMWGMRAESAWFELGKCNGLLGLVPKLE
jgi:hypothetical protein